MPVAFPRAHHEVGILRPAKAAVVAPERAVEVAFFLVEIVAQDDAAKAQVGAQVEQVVVAAADQLGPERHHLHVAHRPGGRHRVLAEVALDLDHAQHELRVEARALCFVVHRDQEFLAPQPVRDAGREALGHGHQPVPGVRLVVEREKGRGFVGNRPVQRGPHACREGLVSLRAGAGDPGHRQRKCPSQPGCSTN